ncbi:MAG: hypothetical protein U0228_06765 [Myxococcaceae bacterium]
MSSLFFPDVVRAVCSAGGVALLLRATAFNEHLKLLPAGWAVLALMVALWGWASFRIVQRDASAPPADVVIGRWRTLSVVQEFVIAGTGALLAVAGCFMLIGPLCMEVWGTSPPEPARISTPEVVMGAVFAALGFMLIFYRPVMHITRTVSRWFPFGLALGWARREWPTSKLRVVSEGFHRTNRGGRLGEMLRVKVAGHQADLEYLPGSSGDEALTQKRAWRERLGLNVED